MTTGTFIHPNAIVETQDIGSGTRIWAFTHILPGAKIDQFRSLISLREKLLKHRTAYKNGISDLHDCYEDGESELIKEIQQRLISNLNDEIKKVEQKIEDIIESDESISSVKHMYKELNYAKMSKNA